MLHSLPCLTTFNIVEYINGRELNNCCGVSSICNSLHIELHLICSVVFCTLPCIFKPDMHHTWLCFMSYSCAGCLLCCVFLSGVASSGCFRYHRVCEDSFDFVRLSS